MLNHLRFKKHLKINETREKEADDLAEKWGFRLLHKTMEEDDEWLESEF